MILVNTLQVRREVNIVGSQDTTGLMTSQESMAAYVISPIVDGAVPIRLSRFSLGYEVMYS
jgi:aconitase B